MKFLESHDLVANFIKKHVDSNRNKDDIAEKVVMALITGTILLHKPSPNKIHHEMLTGDSKSTFYRDVHELAIKMPGMFDGVIDNLQHDAKLAMRKNGIISLDEHVIPHSSPDIEGVDYFHSTTENAQILGLSTITMHYYRGNVEYPVSFTFYRRERELQKRGKEEQFVKKNDISRDMIQAIFSRPNAPDMLLMDSFFMTKENVMLLKNLGVHYISRPKRNWSCSYKHKKMSLVDLFNSIPVDEFKETVSINPKTGRKRNQLTAIRDVFISKIGRHRVVFIDCTKKGDDEDEIIVDNGEELVESGSGRRFKVFVTDHLEWDAATILSKYALRWTIETSYRDMSQDLNLHGCKWRELSGQYCFIALTFLSYVFLMWSKVHGLLTAHGLEVRTIGQLKESFKHYCQVEFAEWFSRLKEQCATCPMANWLSTHLFCGAG